MPILQSEPQIFPDDLLDDLSLQSNWWVVYTLARREKQLCRLLRSQQIPYYCPIVERRYRSPGGRARTSHLPLFSNYVFVAGEELERYHTVSTGCVSQCLAVPDREPFLRELRQVKRLIDLGVPLTPEDQLEPGMEVRVKNGPMEGFEGVVLQRRNNRLLLIRVNFIQRGATVELGDWELDPIV